MSETKRVPAWQRKQREFERVSALECENWNLKHPVGTAVMLRKDTETITTQTRSEAYVADSGHAVIFLKGVSGYYGLDRVTALVSS